MKRMKKRWIGFLVCFCMIFLLVGCAGKEEDDDKEDVIKNGMVVVFFEEETTDEQKEEMQKQISEKSVVTDIKYVSAEEAWEKFQKEYFGEDADAIYSYDENPLANSDNFEIYVEGTEKEIQKLVSYIEEMKGVRKVNSTIYELDETFWEEQTF